MNQNRARITWVEVSLWLATLLILGSIAARLFFGSELRAAEDQLFEAIGLGNGKKYLIIGPLGALWVYSQYAESKREAKARGIPVIRKSVIIFAVFTLIAIGLFLWQSMPNKSLEATPESSEVSSCAGSGALQLPRYAL